MTRARTAERTRAGTGGVPGPRARVVFAAALVAAPALGLDVGLVGCASPPRASTPPAAATADSQRLQLDPLAAIAPGAGLEWLADARPGALLADEEAAAQVARLFPEAAAARFSARYGGVDPRRAAEIVLAGYEGTLFGAARLAVAPAAIEAAFERRAREVEGRAQSQSVVRFWGTVEGAREQVAVFGHEGVAIEHGQLGPLRAAEFFARGKLRRARPAIDAEPLSALFVRLNDPAQPPSSLTFSAPGPFDEPWASGVGGLLRATTAAGVAAACVRAPAGGMDGVTPAGTQGGPDRGAPGVGHEGGPSGAQARPSVWGHGDGCAALRVRVVLEGRWGPDGPAARERLAASFRALAADPLGRLTGLDHPLEGPLFVADETAVELDVTLDLASLVGGIHDATGASLREILGLSAAH